MAISSDKQQIKNKKQHENGLNENGKEEKTIDCYQNEMKLSDNLQNNHFEFGSNFIMLPINNQIKELQTVIRDKYVFKIVYF